MIVIADSNIFISCFYALNNIISKILSSEKNIQFLSLDYIYEEITEHLEDISLKTKQNNRELINILKRYY